MQPIISHDTIEYLSILSKLQLSPEEQAQSANDLETMLTYIDKLNELDTTGIEPMSHIFPSNNVFREDIVNNGDEHDKILSNAPAAKAGSFKVPKTIQ